MATSNIATLIDAFADLRARQAALETEETALKAALADVPAGNYESDKHRLSIIDGERKTDDAELAKKVKTAVADYKLSLTPQYLCAHTVKTPTRTHRIGLPTGKDLAS